MLAGAVGYGLARHMEACRERDRAIEARCQKFNDALDKAHRDAYRDMDLSPEAERILFGPDD